MALRSRSLLAAAVVVVATTGVALVPAGAGTNQTPVGTISEFAAGAGTNPYDATVGRDHAIWFTDYSTNQIGRFDPSTKHLSTFADTGGGGPLGITVGPDGAIWFADSTANKLGRIDPTTHVVTHRTTGALAPGGIVTGPDGALWFTVANASKVGRMNAATGAVTTVATASDPGIYPYLAVGPDNNLWITEYAAGKILRLNPTTHARAEFTIPTTGSGPTEITAGPDGALWFSEYGSSGLGEKIGRITTSGVITEYLTPTPASGPWGIAAGPDGAIWFAEFDTAKIGRLTTSGTFTEFAYEGSGPAGIVAGPDGAMWFPDYNLNAIGRITTGVPGRPTAVTVSSGAASVSVAWTAPTDRGVNPISRYTVTSAPGGSTCVTALLTCRVGGLTNGVAYRFTVTATNGAGSGPRSASSAAATPRQVPARVRGLYVRSSAAGTATATWAAPGSTGGIALTGYGIRWFDTTTSMWTSWTRTGTPSATLGGLVKGHAYLVQVRATNHSGPGVSAGFTFTQSK
ncbi:MAG: fibronectin type III domain-containing protein [Actinomycetes bacterium]